MTRAVTYDEMRSARFLCRSRGHDFLDGCPTCRADIVRLVDGVPAGEATNWRAELLALAELDCLNEDGAKGDDQHSCNRECVTCCARRAVERLPAPRILPTRAEAERALNVFKAAIYWSVGSVSENDARAKLLFLIPTRES
jgi:hypothetical protein